ncbi:MarR family winged helix-turn-helix transcriptional regulator [Nocardioides alkalitolerans]|uniref:MarR family winged helix-turn-helix transcriptional regulator n=1 Tax=Nocardioides alkalitolerans TaxID=281714 RepID=UPI0003FBE438|nr:MarR family transcriptional regulator [Nocardioides alkalitolerans]
MTSFDDRMLLDLETQLLVLLRRMRRNIAERAHEVEPGLAVLAYAVLDQLVRDGSGRAADLGCHLGADKGAMSRAVHQLVELDLVARTTDPEDARAQLLSLTEEGRRRMNAVAERRRGRFAERMSGWEHDEIAALVDGLTRYNRTIDPTAVGTLAEATASR